MAQQDYQPRPTKFKKKRKRRRNRDRYYRHNPLKLPQSILIEMLEDKYLLLDYNKINVGFRTNPKHVTNENVETKEISFNDFNCSSCKIPVEDVIYFSISVKHIKTSLDKIVFLYDRRCGIDRITCSGNTKPPQIWRKIRRLYIDRKIIQNNEKERVQSQQQKTENDEKQMDDDEKNNTNMINLRVQKYLSMNLDKLSRTEYRNIKKDTLMILKRGFYKMYYGEGDDFKKIQKQYEDKHYNSMENTYDYNYYNARPEYQTDRAKQIETLTKKQRVLKIERERMMTNRRYGDDNLMNKVKIKYKIVNIDELQRNAIKNTILYHHNDDYEFIDFDKEKGERKLYERMDIEIVNETTLNAMSVLIKNKDIQNPVALNFASPKSPGSNGLEEMLSRSGGLYETLIKFEKEYYEFHKKHCKSLLYSHSIIYSPNVIIFRDNNCNLLKDLYAFSIISAPAVNAKYFIKRHCGDNMEWIVDTKKIIYDTMKYRIDKILDIAIKHNHDAILLNGFGCHIFGNEPNVIAQIFADLLSTKYRFRFKMVRFSILEFSKKEKIFDAFHYAMKRRFAL